MTPWTSEAGSQAFAVRLGLGPVEASRAEVLAEFGCRLDDYEPALSETPTGIELRLTVAARDVWLAVLMVMPATAGAGYPILWLEAQPVSLPIRRPPPAHDAQD